MTLGPLAINPVGIRVVLRVALMIELKSLTLERQLREIGLFVGNGPRADVPVKWVVHPRAGGSV